MYCECFAKQQTCGPLCECEGCYNNLEHEEYRKLFVMDVVQKNPNAFKPKISNIEED